MFGLVITRTSVILSTGARLNPVSTPLVPVAALEGRLVLGVVAIPLAPPAPSGMESRPLYKERRDPP